MILEGSKVQLKPITKEDTPWIVRWRNTESVRKNFIFQDKFTDEMHNHWMDTKVKSGQVVQFIIIEKEGQKPVGSVYLRDVDKMNRKAEFGIFIGEESARKKGIGTESAQLICEYGFRQLGLHKIMLRVFADNRQAVRSYEKAGFCEEALLRDEICQNGVFRDLILMAKFEHIQSQEKRNDAEANSR